MQFINPIYLVENNNCTSDDNGDVKNIPIERKVLADMASIKQTEFYQAQANGLKPEITFIVRSFEYKGEKNIKHGEKNYRLLRSFDRLDGFTELVCIGVVNNVSS